jgi:signal transduction histidine kinase
MAQTGQINFDPKKLSLQSIVTENIKTSESNARIKNIIIKSNIKEKEFVYADENMLNIIIRNLLTNAIKFTHKDGFVNITSKDENSYITVIVEDNGVGMNANTLEKLFMIDKNHTSRGTANEKGSGLGLMLCKDFIEKNGGKLWVETKLGEGSKFFFTIPKMQ